jgi:hypothetical protein
MLALLMVTDTHARAEEMNSLVDTNTQRILDE